MNEITWSKWMKSIIIILIMSLLVVTHPHYFLGHASDRICLHHVCWEMPSPCWLGRVSTMSAGTCLHHVCWDMPSPCWLGQATTTSAGRCFNHVCWDMPPSCLLVQATTISAGTCQMHINKLMTTKDKTIKNNQTNITMTMKMSGQTHSCFNY